jgi:hypothetical protein
MTIIQIRYSKHSDNIPPQTENLNEIEEQMNLFLQALSDANSRFDLVDLDGILGKFRFVVANSHLLPPPPEDDYPSSARSSLPVLPTPQKANKTTPVKLKEPKKSDKKKEKKVAKKNLVYIYPISEDEFTTLPHYLVGRTSSMFRFYSYRIVGKLNVYLEKLNELFMIVNKWKATPSQKQSPG